MSSLSGIRVLDMSRLLPGPFASSLLIDLGAQVDKLEDNENGDYLRLLPPMRDGVGSIYLALNQKKRSIALDLKKPEGRNAFLECIHHYDVLIESFRPGTLDRLQISHNQLLSQNPKLIVCAISGYGQEGPMARRAGHDINYIARAGILGCQGPAAGVPQIPGVQIADMASGMMAVISILSALLDCRKTGKGRVVDISMTGSATPFAIAQLAQVAAGGSASRGNELLTGGIAAYGVYRTKDDQFMSLGALEPKFWMAFAKDAGLDADVTGVMPGAHQVSLKEKVANVFLSKTRAEWEAFAAERDCCLEPVLAPSEISMPRFESENAPTQGQQTEVILREVGFDQTRIDALRFAGAIR